MTSWNAALVLSLVSLLLATSLFPVTSWDIFWHLRVARDFLESGRFPQNDIYSFSSPGGMYVEDEWLFQACAYLLHRVGGFEALTAAKVLLLFAAGAILFLESRALAGSPAVAALLVSLSAVAARSRLLERPDVLNLLFFPALLVVVSAYRRTGRRRLLFLLPPLFGVWANVHSGVTLGLIILFITALADAACHALRSVLPAPSEGRPAHLALAAILAVPATLINPIGARILTFPFEVVGVHQTIEWRHTPPDQFPLFFVTGALFLILSAWNARSLDLAELSVQALLLGLGIKHVRMMGIFAIVCCLPLARAFGCLVGKLPIPRSAWAREVYRQRIYAAVSAIMLAMTAYFTLWNGYHDLGVGIRTGYFPDRAADFILRERPPANMWNEFTIGGYLLWRLYPDYRVFIDNREEPYYALLAEIKEALQSTESFSRHLDRYGINFSVVRFTPPDHPFVTRGSDGRPVPRGWGLYFEKPAWALVYWDDLTLIYARRSAAEPSWLARLEHQALDPDDWRLAAARAADDPDYRRAVVVELGRKLATDPDCRRARWLMDVFTRP